MEKTAEELRKEIQELQRQHREITDRLRDPRGLRKNSSGATPNKPLFRARPAADPVDEPTPKRIVTSQLVVQVNEEEVQVKGGSVTVSTQDGRAGQAASSQADGSTGSGRPVNSQSNGSFRRDGNLRMRKMDYDMPPPEPLPRVFPKYEDPSLVKRNRRMLGQLLGTLEKFVEEDKQFSSSEAFIRRADSLRKAEEKAREDSEKLRQQERQQIAEKRRRDLTLRARVAAKAEQKRLELLFIQWAEHHKKLSSFIRTKAEPHIYYMPKLSPEEQLNVQKDNEQAFEEWKSARRSELSLYQKQVEEHYLSNVEKQLERLQNARNARRANNAANLQETMDQELETHRMVHGPKTRRIPGGNNEDEDVEDIEADDELMMDEELNAQERIDGDSVKGADAGNGSPGPAEMQEQRGL